MNRLKNESEFQRFLRKSLSYNFLHECHFKKNHGNEYTEKGVSDIDGHIRGMYVAIECKMWNGRPSTVQQAFLRTVSRTGGVGIYTIYRYMDPGHRVYFVPGEMAFSYRMSSVWPWSGTMMVPEDPDEPKGKKTEVFDCSTILTFLTMR